MKKRDADRLRDNIQAVAKQKRIGKHELANNAGIHYDTLRKFLCGASDTTISKAEDIAHALGMTLTGLINWGRRS